MIAPLRARSLPPLRPTSSTPLVERTVDLGAIRRNIGRLRNASGRDVMAVVKADAFGHGAVEVATTAVEAGATWLGVATIDEALALRAAGIDAPVFAWLVDPWCDLEAAIRADITLSCANVETLLAIETAAIDSGRCVDIHLEIDTGMARGGAAPATWDDLCFLAARAERGRLVRVTGAWSHLALAARPHEASVADAVAALERAVAEARMAGLDPTELHLANSAAALAHPVTGFTLVRAGAAVYGIETVEGRSFGLEPALRLTSRVTQVREVDAGTGVGYLHRYRTTGPTLLALVPAGYGDGVPRSLCHGGWVSIGGRPRPVRGAVSMDQLVVEIDATVNLGDEVVLLGAGDAGEPTVLDWAASADTIPHDILTGLGRRAPLVHLDPTNERTR